jgi:hypothetical protein
MYCCLFKMLISDILHSHAWKCETSKCFQVLTKSEVKKSVKVTKHRIVW